MYVCTTYLSLYDDADRICNTILYVILRYTDIFKIKLCLVHRLRMIRFHLTFLSPSEVEVCPARDIAVVTMSQASFGKWKFWNTSPQPWPAPENVELKLKLGAKSQIKTGVRVKSENSTLGVSNNNIRPFCETKDKWLWKYWCKNSLV